MPLFQSDLLLPLSLYCLVATSTVWAEEFYLANETDSVVGEIRKARTTAKDTLLDVARANGLGYQEIKRVNPTLDTWLPGTDMEVVLPTRYVLPMARRVGIVLNIPEMRLYHFPEVAPGQPVKVVTYPLGVGREGWRTPYINTRIIEKKKHPSWHPPESIREEHAAKGDILPVRVGPGPDNPLGDYAMRLGLPDYLIHGTNKPFGVGMRVSHGCIRLYPEDIAELFQHVPLRTPVNIINQPYKVGRLNDKIYLEAHPFLEEDSEEFRDNLTSVVKMIVKLTEEENYRIEWDLAKQVIQEMHGIPVVIGRISPPTTMQAGADSQMLDAPGGKKGLKLQLETGITR